jgi:hypothetical protein
VNPPLTYVYCLVRAPRRPSLRDVPEGMSGGDEVRLLDVAPATWLAVSSVPASDYGEEALQRGLQNMDWVGRRALAHEAVVEHFLAAPAVLPMQLFALFTSDERAVAHVTRDKRRIGRILDRIERQHEWGLRLTFDEKAAREKVEGAHAGGSGRGARGVKARAKAPVSGSAYLARKRDLLDVNRAQLVAARAEADRLYRAISREASAHRRRTATEQAAPGSRLLLDAAFLVPVKRASAFRTAVRRNARKLEGSGVAVSLTGPWPPYNFI